MDMDDEPPPPPGPVKKPYPPPGAYHDAIHSYEYTGKKHGKLTGATVVRYLRINRTEVRTFKEKGAHNVMDGDAADKDDEVAVYGRDVTVTAMSDDAIYFAFRKGGKGKTTEMMVHRADNLSEMGPEEEDLHYEFGLAQNFLSIPIMSDGGRGTPIMKKAAIKHMIPS